MELLEYKILHFLKINYFKDVFDAHCSSYLGHCYIKTIHSEAKCCMKTFNMFNTHTDYKTPLVYHVYQISECSNYKQY